jgi:putative Holliday junction resolvase
MIDERYTTAAARRAIREMGGDIRGRRGDVDALAATVLLQHALRSEDAGESTEPRSGEDP